MDTLRQDKWQSISHNNFNYLINKKYPIEVSQEYSCFYLRE